MSEKRKYRTFTPEQKTEIVLAGLRGDRTVRDICREYEIAETLYYQWRDRLLEGGKAALATPRDKSGDPRDGELREAKKRIAHLERALGRKTYEVDAVVAIGRRPAVVARVAGISRQAIYRPVTTRPAAAGPGRGRPGDDAIVEVARANPTDGTRMVAALASRELGEAVNRKRAQRVMRAHKLLQPTRGNDRRRRPGFFRVRRPDELWHMDMTKVWTAAHGWVYLHVIVDCCTREIAGWTVDVRTRSDEAIACVDSALFGRAVKPGVLTLGSDNGSQFTSREFRKHLCARGVTHRRGGYRDPESQAFIESWFGQFKKRCAWRAEWETIEQARTEITAYIDRYHHRPHSGLAYRTPAEVAETWRRMQDLQTEAT